MPIKAWGLSVILAFYPFVVNATDVDKHLECFEAKNEEICFISHALEIAKTIHDKEKKEDAVEALITAANYSRVKNEEIYNLAIETLRDAKNIAYVSNMMNRIRHYQQRHGFAEIVKKGDVSYYLSRNYMMADGFDKYTIIFDVCDTLGEDGDNEEWASLRKTYCVLDEKTAVEINDLVPSLANVIAPMVAIMQGEEAFLRSIKSLQTHIKNLQVFMAAPRFTEKNIDVVFYFESSLSMLGYALLNANHIEGVGLYLRYIDGTDMGSKYTGLGGNIVMLDKAFLLGATGRKGEAIAILKSHIQEMGGKTEYKDHLVRTLCASATNAYTIRNGYKPAVDFSRSDTILRRKQKTHGVRLGVISEMDRQ